MKQTKEEKRKRMQEAFEDRMVDSILNVFSENPDIEKRIKKYLKINKRDGAAYGRE